MIHADWHAARVALAQAYFTQNRPDPMTGNMQLYASTHQVQFVRYYGDELVFVFTPTYQRLIIEVVSNYPSDASGYPTLMILDLMVHGFTKAMGPLYGCF